MWSSVHKKWNIQLYLSSPCPPLLSFRVFCYTDDIDRCRQRCNYQCMQSLSKLYSKRHGLATWGSNPGRTIVSLWCYNVRLSWRAVEGQVKRDFYLEKHPCVSSQTFILPFFLHGIVVIWEIWDMVHHHCTIGGSSPQPFCYLSLNCCRWLIGES